MGIDCRERPRRQERERGSGIGVPAAPSSERSDSIFA